MKKYKIESDLDTFDTSDTDNNSPKNETIPKEYPLTIVSNQPERWRKHEPTFLQTYFTRGWKHRIFSNSGNGSRFVALTQAIITS